MHALKSIIAAIVLASAAWASPAMAGPYGDDLSKCLVNASSPEDKQGLVQWIFFAIALNPNTEPYARVTPELRTQADKRMAQLLEKLLTESCVKEAKRAIQYEGNAALQEALGMLARVATTEIFSNPQVSAGSEEFMQYLDIDKINAAIGVTKPTE